MRVVVLGSTGLLGRAVTAELAAQGHAVLGISRSGAGCPEAPGSTARALDVAGARPADLEQLLAGADVVVHALGPDDRTRPPAPARSHFQTLLADVTERVAAAAQRTGVARLVIFGSYFTAVDRLQPDWQLAARHPYIAVRAAQAAQARAAAPTVDVSVVEIPYVLGAVGQLVPAWTALLLGPLRRSPVGFALPGGAAAVRVTEVAYAVRLLAEGRVAAGDHPVASDNLDFRRLTRVALEALGRRAPVVTVPRSALAATLRSEGWLLARRGLDSGLDLLHLPDLLCHNTFLDLTEVESTFGIHGQPIDDEIRTTVRTAYR